MKRQEFNKAQQEAIVRLYTDKHLGVIAVGEKFGVSRTVIERVLNENNVYLRNMVESHKGQRPWNKGKQWSEAVRAKISLKSQNRGGAKNPNWKGGNAPKRDLRRNLRIVKEWRAKCLQRDGKCLWCGSREQLEVNHIVPIRQINDIELLCDINNGITLCRKCHYKIHYHEHEYADILRKLIKNPVNSGESQNGQS